MKLRNKKTGEIKEFDGVKVLKNSDCTIAQFSYDSLAELNEEWEDYEEPKDVQCIYYVNHFDTAKINGVLVEFATEEEAKRAVEKLNAWQRLKDKGFEFTFWDMRSGSSKDGHCEGEFVMFSECPNDIEKADLDLLFGGEE